jgi:hypothetical protein
MPSIITTTGIKLGLLVNSIAFLIISSKFLFLDFSSKNISTNQIKDRLDDSNFNFEDEYIADVMGRLADLSSWIACQNNLSRL